MQSSPGQVRIRDSGRPWVNDPEARTGSFALAALMGLTLLSGTVLAQSALPGTFLAHSYSGQFLVVGRPFGSPSRQVLNLLTNKNVVPLEPTLVTVSCERIKQSLLRKLQASPAWNGKIFIVLYPGNSLDSPVTLASERYRDGWQYRLMLPNVIDRTRYVRTIVSAILQETANRGATDRSAELPWWLTEGLTQDLLASESREIILPPPRAAPDGVSPPATFVTAREENPLRQLHEILCAGPSLSFQQLSWPDPDQLAGATGETYRRSAQFFVMELLRLEGGPACLRAMLARLPAHYNWQFAFLEGFHAYFRRPLDIEKWWTLHLVHFTGRELAQTWPPEESWQKLDELVCSRVQVRARTNDLPLQAEVPLQTIIREWDSSRETIALRTKIFELEQLRLRLTPELARLADSYCQILGKYLEARDHPGTLLPFRKAAARRRAAEDAIQQLDALDKRRAELRPSQPKTAAPANPRSPAPPR